MLKFSKENVTVTLLLPWNSRENYFICCESLGCRDFIGRRHILCYGKEHCLVYNSCKLLRLWCNLGVSIHFLLGLSCIDSFSLGFPPLCLLSWVAEETKKSYFQYLTGVIMTSLLLVYVVDPDLLMEYFQMTMTISPKVFRPSCV